MGESADFDDAGAIAVSIGNTNLVGTGLAKESGGNLDRHSALLGGTSAGALLGTAGNTLAYEIASMLANGNNTGVAGSIPLLHGARNVYLSGNQTILPTATFQPANIPFTRPGYLFRITANFGVGLAVAPYVKIDLTWLMAAQNIATWEENWYIYGGNNNNKRSNGRGPALGDTMQIAVTNGDAVNSVIVNIDIYETTHAPARSDWRDIDAAPSSGASKVVNKTAANILADVNSTVGANSLLQLNLPLYAGQAQLWLNQNTHAGSTVQIAPVGAFDLANQEPLIDIDWTLAPNVYEGIILPRCPCAIIAQNVGASAATLLASMTALEYAS